MLKFTQNMVQQSFHKFHAENCISSLIGRMSYVGFFFDWTIEVIGGTADFLTMILSASICVGIAYYINGMVEDMKMRFRSIDGDLTSEPRQSRQPHQPRVTVQIWPLYVQEIDFHNEIIGYLSTFQCVFVVYSIIFLCL